VSIDLTLHTGLHCNPSPIPSRLRHQQRRAASSDSNDQGTPARSNPILDEYRRQHGNAQNTPGGPQIAPKAGDIASSSIFEDDRRTQQQVAETSGAAETKTGNTPRDPQNMLRVLDPDPNARERWERKKVIQALKKGGRLTKEQFVKRTERKHLAKSENMKTSVKKLGMLARQITGKTLEEAIVQMRFSKKKIAQEVLKHLESARDEAVVMRGMGLGHLSATEAVDAPSMPPSSASITGIQPFSTAVPSSMSPLDIELKNGKRHTVADASKIYVEQAWVGRGPFGQLPDYRARGRVYIMRTPWTSLTIVLKEEATRVREWQEKEEKRMKQRKDNVWMPLPDRPVQGPRGQWYSW